MLCERDVVVERRESWMIKSATSEKATAAAARNATRIFYRTKEGRHETVHAYYVGERQKEYKVTCGMIGMTTNSQDDEGRIKTSRTRETRQVR